VRGLSAKGRIGIVDVHAKRAGTLGLLNGVNPSIKEGKSIRRVCTALYSVVELHLEDGIAVTIGGFIRSDLGDGGILSTMAIKDQKPVLFTH